ncbi:MAG: phytoene/squalene synthase family protein [Gemmatimonadaceae bacterium]
MRSHSRTFHLASYFLAAEKRRGALALYAFCRLADDIVDDATIRGHSPTQVRSRLQQHAARLEAALNGRPDAAVFREVAWTVERFDVPRAPLDELLRGVARDLEGCAYTSWEQLEGYCDGVASSVGEMCTHVWGVRPDASLPTAVAHARLLGTAMQLTNILRDVGEDAQRGRCYLPANELAAHGFTPDDVLTGRLLERRGAWSSLMQEQIGRARDLYERARPGIAMLSPDAQRCATACAAGYAGILDAIVANDFDNITQRARVGWMGRAALLARTWWLPAPAEEDAEATATADARSADAASPAYLA